jgi:cytochrome c553
MRRTLLALLVLGACSVGEVKTGGGPDAGAGGSVSFTMKVAPLVTRCTGCHGNAQSQPTLTSFDALQAKYKTKPGEQNILVTKDLGVKHHDIDYLSTAERQQVADWINSL